MSRDVQTTARYARGQNLKQRELAEMLNVSQTTYSRYESGELDIPSAALIKLADFYNVSVDYILGRTDK